MRAGILAQSVLLLLLLLDSQVSDAGAFTGTMGVGANHRSVTVGATAWIVDLEYESFCGGCKQ